MTPILILGIGLLMAAMLMIIALAGPSAGKATARRLENLKDRHSTSTASMAQAQMRRILAQRDTRMDTLASRLIPNPALLRLRLSRTGKSWTLGQYALVSGGVLIGMSFLLVMKGVPILLALMLGIFCGLVIPHMVTGSLIKRRINKFTSRFPDAIELLVRGLRSGLPISETLGLVGKEVPDPVGAEFRNVADKIKIGRTMDAALQETADRLGTPEFQFFVISLQIQRETGGNLAETLSNLAEVLRKRAQMKLKIRAMSSESKASAYIIGSLPFIVFGLIWFINGSYMQTFFIDPRLMVAGMVGMVWMAIGAFIMAKMINFEIEDDKMEGGPKLLGIEVVYVATVLAAVASFAVLIAIWAATTVRDPMVKRVKALNDRREQLKAGITASTSKRRARLTGTSDTTDWMRSVLKSLKVLQDSQMQKAQRKLMQAGIRSKDAAIAVIFARMVLPIALGAIMALGLYGLDWFPLWGPAKRYALLAFTVIASYKAPDIYVTNKKNKRTSAIRKGLPDGLDLLVICAEAGLTVDAAFGRVAKELGRAYPELGDEFALTAIELSFLTDRRMAFENLSMRVDLEAVRGVVTTMIQTEKYGTPLASALRVLSAEFRNERMMRAEEKAARLPAIMTVPLILFILPVLFVVILGPAACSIADAFGSKGV